LIETASKGNLSTSKAPEKKKKTDDQGKDKTSCRVEHRNPS